MYLNLSLATCAEVPPPVTTRMATVPCPFGDVTFGEPVELMTTTCTPRLEPKSTDSTPVKLAPRTVTTVPPRAFPLFGEIDATVGAGGRARQDVRRGARDPGALEPDLERELPGGGRRSFEQPARRDGQSRGKRPVLDAPVDVLPVPPFPVSCSA